MNPTPKRTRLSFLTGVAAATATLLASCSKPPFPLEEYLVPPGAAVLGHDQALLGDSWWRWYFEYAPGSDDLDSPDISCHAQGQPRGPFVQPEVPVDFLAGSGGRGMVERTCSLQEGRHLFLPILTTMVAVAEPSDEQCAFYGQREDRLNAQVPEMEVRINGVLVPDMAQRRVSQHECTMLSPEHGLVFDGFWLALKPLPKGEHTIEFFARYDDDEHPLGRLRQDVRYHLTVR